MKTWYFFAIAAIAFAIAGAELFWQKPSEASAKHLSWEILRTRGAKQYSGHRVRLAGFMIPFEDSATKVSEFLLLPVNLSCIHVPPPPPNQVVHVRMKKPIDYTWKAFWVSGTFGLEPSSVLDYRSVYSLEGDSTEVYEGTGFQIYD